MAQRAQLFLMVRSQSASTEPTHYNRHEDSPKCPLNSYCPPRPLAHTALLSLNPTPVLCRMRLTRRLLRVARCSALLAGRSQIVGNAESAVYEAATYQQGCDQPHTNDEESEGQGDAPCHSFFVSTQGKVLQCLSHSPEAECRNSRAAKAHHTFVIVVQPLVRRFTAPNARYLCPATVERPESLPPQLIAPACSLNPWQDRPLRSRLLFENVYLDGRFVNNAATEPPSACQGAYARNSERHP